MRHRRSGAKRSLQSTVALERLLQALCGTAQMWMPSCDMISAGEPWSEPATEEAATLHVLPPSGDIPYVSCCLAVFFASRRSSLPGTMIL